MADTHTARRFLALKWALLPAAVLALGGLLASPVWATDPGSMPVRVARASGALSAGPQGPVELAAGDPLGQHVFPEEFPDIDDAVPAAPVPPEGPQPSPVEFQEQIGHWLGRWGLVETSPGR
jgi:hypothetical protein